MMEYAAKQAGVNPEDFVFKNFEEIMNPQQGSSLSEEQINDYEATKQKMKNLFQSN